MSRSTLSQVWRWSVMTSPLLNAWKRLRHMGYPNHKSDALLDAVDLPKPIDDLIRETVKRSKLWCNERLEIAQELIAHAQDAIKAERSNQDIVNTFGNPKHIAKLMRRSMKRKRPLYWRAYRNMRRATWVMVLLLIVGYGSLAVRFYMGKPSIKRNYIAELNARNDQYTEDQKAWSVYQDVDLEWQRLTLRAWELENFDESRNPVGRRTAERTFRNSWLKDIQELEPDDPRYRQGVELFRSFEPQLARIRAAAARPVCGLLYSDRSESREMEPGIWVFDTEPPSPDPQLQKSVIHVLLPNLGMQRRYAQLLDFDIELAILEQDTQRVFDNLVAIINIARQCNQEPFLISKLVGVSIHELFAETFISVIKAPSSELSKDQLVQLAHIHAEVKTQGDQSRMNMMNSEQMSIEDLLQRTFTDDGHGNGRLTAGGLEAIKGVYTSSNEPQTPDLLSELLDNEISRDFMLPLTLVKSADRATERMRYLRATHRVNQVMREGPQSISLLDKIAHELSRYSGKSELEFSLTGIMMPAFGAAVNRVFIHQQRNSALSVALALEVFRIDQGAYPTSLNQLTPLYLPSVPEDMMNPGYPIQYILDQNGYILYSAGSDGDLDGGVERDKEGQSQSFYDRFPFQYGFYETLLGESKSQAVLGPDGQPKLFPPTGPDSDWILVDTRSDSDSTNGE